MTREAFKDACAAVAILALIVFVAVVLPAMRGA